MPQFKRSMPLVTGSLLSPSLYAKHELGELDELFCRGQHQLDVQGLRRLLVDSCS